MAITSGNCSKCGAWRRSLHRDHIISKWKGGSDELENIQLLCANCHEEKTAEDMKGHPVSKEQREAHSKRMKGRTLTAEHRAKLGPAHKGKKYKPWSQEARANLSAARKSVPWTPERRASHGRSTLNGLARKAEIEALRLKSELEESQIKS